MNIGRGFLSSILCICISPFVFYGCEDNSTNCLELTQQGNTQIVPPSGVRVSFSVSTCDGEPVPTILEEGEFSIINDETGQPFGSEGGAAPTLGQARGFSFYTILLLDLSYSITNPDNYQLDDVLDGASAFVKQMVEDQTDPRLKHQVALYVFGGTDSSETWTQPDGGDSFTKDHSILYQRLEALRNDPGRGSTNLYGAFLAGINIVRSHGSGELVVRTQVILTDGTHETGDLDTLRQSALSELEVGDVDSYSIPIRGDYNPEAICELASREDNCVQAEDSSHLVQALQDIATQVDGWSKSNYVMGVCSPVEGPNRSLTIKAKWRGAVGRLTIEYDASGFSLVGCDPDTVSDPCGERECGEVLDVACGTCGATKPNCTQDGRCVSSLSCPADMVFVETLSVCIDRFEASRTDATASSQGAANLEARSVPSVIPWSSASWQEAASACSAVGKRLCTAEEWGAACGGISFTAYPYGETYSAYSCNGGDSSNDAVVPTGSVSTCEGGYVGIFDLSGNLWEWTDTCNVSECTQMGGAWYISGENISCTTSRIVSEVTQDQNTGFRCCK